MSYLSSMFPSFVTESLSFCLLICSITFRWKSFKLWGIQSKLSLLPIISDYHYDNLINCKWCFQTRLYLEILLIIVLPLYSFRIWVWSKMYGGLVAFIVRALLPDLVITALSFIPGILGMVEAILMCDNEEFGIQQKWFLSIANTPLLIFILSVSSLVGKFVFLMLRFL